MNSLSFETDRGEVRLHGSFTHQFMIDGLDYEISIGVGVLDFIFGPEYTQDIGEVARFISDNREMLMDVLSDFKEERCYRYGYCVGRGCGSPHIYYYRAVTDVAKNLIMYRIESNKTKRANS